MLTDDELLHLFDELPERGKHFVRVIRDELMDLRARVDELEKTVASTEDRGRRV